MLGLKSESIATRLNSPFDIVLFSGDYLPNIGGIATHVHELARALRSLEQKVCIFTVREKSLKRPNTWRSRWTVREEVPVLELSLIDLPGERGRYWWLPHSARQALRAFSNPNRKVVLHCHEYWYGVSVASNCPGSVKVFTNHTSTFLQDLEDSSTHSEWQRRLSVYDWVIAPSEELSTGTSALGYDARRISFVPNGVDTDRFKPDCALRHQARKELELLESDTVLLCARRMVPKNGVIDFAHSLRFLSDYADNIVVLFAGNQNRWDSYEAETIAAAKRWLPTSRVRFLGSVSNAQMQRLYVASDIAVLPSLKEATSITGLEAMACGLPLVGTRVGGISDLIDHEVTGLLTEPGDPRDFAHAVSRLLSEPVLRREFGKKARAKVADRFTWKHIAARTLRVYEQARQTAANSNGS